MSEEPAIPAEACERAVWTTHPMSEQPALQCTRWTGAGGAVWLAASAPACRLCRCNAAGLIVPEGRDLVDQMAARLSHGMGPDFEPSKAHLLEVMSKGRSGIDLDEPGAQELVQKILVAACARGLKPEDAEKLADDCGLTAALERAAGG